MNLLHAFCKCAYIILILIFMHIYSENYFKFMSNNKLKIFFIYQMLIAFYFQAIYLLFLQSVRAVWEFRNRSYPPTSFLSFSFHPKRATCNLLVSPGLSFSLSPYVSHLQIGIPTQRGIRVRKRLILPTVFWPRSNRLASVAASARKKNENEERRRYVDESPNREQNLFRSLKSNSLGTAYLIHYCT